MKLSRIARKYARIPLTVTLADGSPASVPGVDVALLPLGATPTADTEWIPVTVDNGAAVVLVAGPDADPEDALVIPADGVYVWVRITDNPEVDVAKVGKLSVA